MKHRTIYLFISLITTLFICSGLLLSTDPVSARPPTPNNPSVPPFEPLNPQGRSCTIVRVGSEDTQPDPPHDGEASLARQTTDHDIHANPKDIQRDDPGIVADADGNLYAIWVDRRNAALNIYFASSKNGGETWSDDIRVNDIAQDDHPNVIEGADLYAAPSLGIDSQGRLYATWVDTRNGNPDIYFARSVDKGRTWRTNVRVNDDTGGVGQYDPTMAVASLPDGTSTNPVIYVAWEDYRNEYPTIYMAQSDDGGFTWSDDVQVSPLSGAAENPQIVVDSNGVAYCVWCHEYIRDPSIGMVIPNPEDQDEIDPPDGGGDPTEPENGHDIYFARSGDMGTTWSDPVIINDGVSGSAETPDIAVGSDNTLYVVWHDSRAGNPDIYIAQSSDGGQTWGANLQINDNTTMTNQLIPSITVDISGTLHVAWEDYRNNNADIYASASIDGGRSWSSNVKLNDDTEGAIQGYPILIAVRNTIYAAWKDTRSGLPDIYFSKSSDDGSTWSENKSADTKGSVVDERFKILLPIITNLPVESAALDTH